MATKNIKNGLRLTVYCPKCDKQLSQIKVYGQTGSSKGMFYDCACGFQEQLYKRSYKQYRSSLV